MKFNDLKIKTQLILENAAILLVLVSLGVVFIEKTSTLDKNAKWVSHTYKVIGEARSLLARVVDMETGMRGYVVSGDKEFLEPYNMSREVFENDVKVLKESVSDNPIQVERVNRIYSLAKTWKKEVAEKYINLRSEISKGERIEKEIAEIIESGVGKKSMDRIRDLVARSGMRSEGKDKIILDMVNMETGLRGFLLDENEVFLEPFEMGRKNISARLSTYNASESIRTAIDDWLNDYAAKLIKLQEEEVEMAEIEDLYALFNQKQGKEYMDEIRVAITDFVKLEQQLLTEREEKAEHEVQTTVKITIWAILLILLFSIIVVTVIVRSINQSIRSAVKVAKAISKGDLNSTITVDSNNELGELKRALKGMQHKLKEIGFTIVKTSGTLAAVSNQLSSSFSEQAASTEELSSSMEEMSSNIEQNTQNSMMTETIANKASQEIASGYEGVKKTVESMRVISEKISVIEEIAEKTDLLAINTAIEAARAGEYGQGFAVVAQEVRKLAEQSQVAASQINTLSKESVKIAEDTGNKMAEIVPEIVRTSQLVQEITSASREQNSGSAQVNMALQQLNSLNQTTASNAEELSRQSEELRLIVNFFKIDELNRSKKVYEEEVEGEQHDLLAEDEEGKEEEDNFVNY